jgi:hypothetical protein
MRWCNMHPIELNLFSCGEVGEVLGLLCSQCVLIMFPLCWRQVPNGFPNMFPIVCHFVPCAHPTLSSWNLQRWADIETYMSLGLEWILLYLEISKVPKLFWDGRIEEAHRDKILNLEGTRPPPTSSPPINQYEIRLEQVRGSPAVLGMSSWNI